MELLLMETFSVGTLAYSPVRVKGYFPTGSGTPSSNHVVGIDFPRLKSGSLL
jgi:hypothetical protein